MPRGCALIVSRPGSARHSLTRLAAVVAQTEILEWVIPKGGNAGGEGGNTSQDGSKEVAQAKAQLMDKLKNAIKMAGIHAKDVAMVVDMEHADAQTLDMVNQYLSIGRLPEILSKDDVDAIVEEVLGATTAEAEAGSTPRTPAGLGTLQHMNSQASWGLPAKGRRVSIVSSPNVLSSKSMLEVVAAAPPKDKDSGGNGASTIATTSSISNGNSNGTGKASTDLYSKFLACLRECFHIVLICAPGERLVQAVRGCPGVVRGCTVMWFSPWRVRIICHVSCLRCGLARCGRFSVYIVCGIRSVFTCKSTCMFSKCKPRFWHAMRSCVQVPCLHGSMIPAVMANAAGLPVHTNHV
jgi:hypothetical protein